MGRKSINTQTSINLGVLLSLVVCACCSEPSASQIHVVGNYGSWNSAFHWNDGVLTVLDEPEGDTHVNAISVFVANGIVNVAGSYSGQACIWEDSVRQELGCSGRVTSVVIDGDHRYLAGSCEQVGSLWIDEERSPLEVPEGSQGWPVAMVVANGDVTVAGYHRPDDVLVSSQPCTWRNGVRHDLPTPEPLTPGAAEVQVYDVAISGDTVYVAGTQNAFDPNRGAGYWVDDQWIDLDGTSARAIAVVESVVYVAGRDDEGACYWRDGEKIRLEHIFSTIATAIATQDDAVVIGGECGTIDGPDQIGYWANEEEFTQILEEGVAEVTSVFVMPN